MTKIPPTRGRRLSERWHRQAGRLQRNQPHVTGREARLEGEGSHRLERIFRCAGLVSCNSRSDRWPEVRGAAARLDRGVIHRSPRKCVLFFVSRYYSLACHNALCCDLESGRLRSLVPHRLVGICKSGDTDKSLGEKRTKKSA